MAHGISVPTGGRAVSRGPKRLLALRGDDYLVERLRRGDESAFEVIYERHVPGVLSFCRHMLGSPEEAEDAVQQAFTAAHRDLLRDEREIRLKPWLYAIARNRCLSMLRARREEAEERVEASTDGLDDQVQRRAELRELVEDLHDLPEDQRAALVLSELRDLSHAEVAEVLGCRVANVKGLVFRARTGLSERREARDATCETIREELATAQGGTLRRGRLRHHLRACSGCSAYLEEVRNQRKMMAMILPVAPSVGLKSGVLGAVGIGGGGGGAAAGGGLLAALLPVSGATVAKVAVVGALVAGGGGLVGEAALDGGGSPPNSWPAVAPRPPAVLPADSPLPGIDSAAAADQKGSDSARPGATKAARQKLKRARARGRARRPLTANPHRRSGGGRAVKRRVRGDAPKAERAPRRSPAKALAPTRVKPRPKAKPPRESGRALGKTLPTPWIRPAAPDG